MGDVRKMVMSGLDSDEDVTDLSAQTLAYIACLYLASFPGLPHTSEQSNHFSLLASNTCAGKVWVQA